MAAVFGLLIVGIVYFVPTIIAWSRRHNEGSVLVVNLFLGWTFVGWVVALAMAAGGSSRPDRVVIEYREPPASGGVERWNDGTPRAPEHRVG